MEHIKDTFHILPWDSKLFGYKVAQLTKQVSGNALRLVLKHAKSANAKLIYWFVDPLDANANDQAIVNNGILIDKKVTYVIDFEKYKKMAEDHGSVCSYGGKHVRGEILALALQSGLYSRFFIDTHFVQNEYEKLYTKWITKSIHHIIAFDIIVYTDESGIIKGFISLESKGQNGSIGLFAVDKNFRGKSIGKILVKKAFKEFGKRRYKKIYVTTQGNNTVACHFYEKLGFIQYKTENVYHFWL